VVILASGGIRTAWDVAKIIALGADGVVLGTSELVAVNCVRCGNCERGRGCPIGIATTDAGLSALLAPAWGKNRISNLFRAYYLELQNILRRLGVPHIRQLVGRTDLVDYS
ncbi:MAG TPA: glutamate synthase-related protein, partial [Planctomycetota bacterium]|nr:glutamate synthase-related protein [Planctomycetota bacterium]